MSNLILHPRVAPSDRVRVWVGAFDRTDAPALAWRLDGQPLVPTPIRALASARPVPDQAAADEPRAFTGVFEFPMADDLSHRLELVAGADRATLTVGSMPAELPSGPSERFPDGWFNVLLVSCFHWAEDKSGLAGAVVRDLPRDHRPHMTLLLGDQVYLDLPTLKNFRDDLRWLADKFEDDYRRNWLQSSAFALVLAAAPSLAAPDDHEFWNNYPHASPVVQNSLSDGGRRRWAAAARALHEAFQAPWDGGATGQPPFVLGDPVIVDVPPVSFCLADTRTCRDRNRASVLRPGAIDAIERWADRVVDTRAIPVFGAGQALFTEPAGALSGSIADFELADYGDFPALASVLGRLATADRNLVFITGDVHWGRVSVGRSRASGRDEVWEIISSPASLVSTVGSDQFRRAKAWVAGWFGGGDPWPRHDDAPTPPDTFPDGGPVRFDCTRIHPQRGNQIAVLSFRRARGGVEMRTTYFPVHDESRLRQPASVEVVKIG